MDLSQKNETTPFVDFIPAELRENQTWEIVYYVKNPITKKLIRKRNRVKPLKSVAMRRKLAKKMVYNINIRLENGWNPFYDTKGAKQYHSFIEACDTYLNRVETDFKDGNLRKDTFKTYKSNIAQIKKFIIEFLGIENFMCYQFDSEFVGKYLDHIKYTRNLSSRTRDNALGFLGTLSSFLLHKKYISANPTMSFKRINRKTKKRVLISEQQRESIFNHFEKNNFNFLVLCMACYYCLVRRTELTKLRVGDVSIKNQTLFIDALDSKNRKSAHVTIPDNFVKHLIKHINGYPNDFYLFSTNSYKPGEKQLNPDRVTKEWAKMRKAMKLNANIHWYSLKDSGITDLLLAGVPLLSVRNQARHHSSNQTDLYTPKSMRKGDTNIKSSSVKFND